MSPCFCNRQDHNCNKCEKHNTPVDPKILIKEPIIDVCLLDEDDGYLD
jgi:hypothetical protein